MKHSKLFLGITSGFLAVVGVTAAKNHSAISGNPFYWTNEVTKIHCVQDLVDQFGYQTLQPGQAQLVGVVSGVGTRHLYVTSNCTVPAAIE